MNPKRPRFQPIGQEDCKVGHFDDQCPMTNDQKAEFFGHWLSVIGTLQFPWPIGAACFPRLEPGTIASNVPAGARPSRQGSQD